MERLNQSASREVGQHRVPLRLGIGLNDTVAMHIVYALYGLSTITGVPSILGVILAYYVRASVSDTWLQSHVTWQIRTFWSMLIASIVAMVLNATYILMPIGFSILGVVWLWFVYRTVKGWLALANERAIEEPQNWF